MSFDLEMGSRDYRECPDYKTFAVLWAAQRAAEEASRVPRKRRRSKRRSKPGANDAR